MNTLTHARAGELIDHTRTIVIRPVRVTPPLPALFKRAGHWAAARHCYKLGIPFEDAYFAAFGKYPRHFEAVAWAILPPH